MSQKGRYIIYGLTDPQDGRVRYVGRSMHGIVRANRHRTKALLKERNAKAEWIKTLLRTGLDYGVVVLEEVPSSEDLSASEIKWISIMRERHSDLLNMSYGGEAHNVGNSMSEEAKEKIRQGNLGQKRSPESCARMSKVRTGEKRTEEVKKRISDAHIGVQEGEKHPLAKLTDDSVREMRAFHAAGESCLSLSRRFNVHHSTAYSAIIGRTWKHV